MFRHAAWSGHPQDEASMEEFQLWFAMAFFDQETKERLLKRFGPQDAKMRPVCHTLQLLNVMRLALLEAEGDENSRPDSDSHRFQFGMACLMANDLLITEQEKENLKSGSLDERRRQLMLQALPTLEVSAPTPLRHLLFRCYATYRVALRDEQLVARIFNECGGLDLEEEFERQIGIPVFEWLSLVFGVQTLLMMNTFQDLINRPELFIINRKTILTNPNLTQGQIDNFFDALARDFEGLKGEIRKCRPVDDRFDLVPFKSAPLLNTAPDNYACLDFTLLTERLHNGPYFLLGNRLPESERGKVFKAWGLLFEVYVNWLLSSLQRRHSVAFFPDTCWENGDKSFDAVFVRKRMVVVMEFKAGFLKQDARYSNDLDAFTKDLQSKIGVGCQQLARDVSGLFPAHGPAKRLQNVAIPTNALWVLPILVVQDVMLRTFGVNYFLNQRFQSERLKFQTREGVAVLPLTVAHITQVESLVEMAEAFDLDVIHFLHRRCQVDNEMLGDLQDFISALPQAREARCSERFEKIFQMSSNEMSAIFFKDRAAVPRSDTVG